VRLEKKRGIGEKSREKGGERGKGLPFATKGKREKKDCLFTTQVPFPPPQKKKRANAKREKIWGRHRGKVPLARIETAIWIRMHKKKRGAVKEKKKELGMF